MVLSKRQVRAAAVLALTGLLGGCSSGGDGGSAVPGPNPGPGGCTVAAGGTSLRFPGTNRVAPDERVKVLIDDPGNAAPGPSADIGATDATIEFWMRVTSLNDNPAGAIACGANNEWVRSNILLDRDRHSQNLHYGAGLANNTLVFSVSNAFSGVTVCRDDGQPDVRPGQWQHVALQRRMSDGHLWILVDGQTVVSEAGPPGDISYPDDGVPATGTCPFNGGDCVYSDPYVVFGAEKHGYSDISFAGWMDEIRLSTVLRYGAPSEGDSYAVPCAPFTPDAQTAALYHLDAGSGTTLIDATGQNNGDVNPGGLADGPQWSSETPFN